MIKRILLTATALLTLVGFSASTVVAADEAKPAAEKKAKKKASKKAKKAKKKAAKKAEAAK